MAGSYITTRKDEKPYKLSNLNARCKIIFKKFTLKSTATSPAVAAHWFQVQAKYICSPNH
jgi:hypothetical protein